MVSRYLISCRLRRLAALAGWVASMLLLLVASVSCREDDDRAQEAVGIFCRALGFNLVLMLDSFESDELVVDHEGRVSDWWFIHTMGVDNASVLRRRLNVCLDARVLPGQSVERATLRVEIERWAGRLEALRSGYPMGAEVAHVLNGFNSLVERINGYPISAWTVRTRDVVRGYCTDLQVRLERSADLVEAREPGFRDSLGALGTDNPGSLRSPIYLCSGAIETRDSLDRARYYDRADALLDPYRRLPFRADPVDQPDYAELLSGLAQLVAETNRARSDR